MTAIPKALAMANPKYVVACVATVAGLISSKFAIDELGNFKDDTGIKEDERPDDVFVKDFPNEQEGVWKE